MYYTDNADNRYVKRVSVDGGPPETVVKAAIGVFALSPDGKEIASLDVREFDHKLILRRDSTETQKMTYHDIDQRALPEGLTVYAGWQGDRISSKGKGSGQSVAATPGWGDVSPVDPFHERSDLAGGVFTGWNESGDRERRNGVGRGVVA